MVELNGGHRRAETVVCVNRVRELRSWLHDPASATVHLGAAVTYAELMDEPLAGLLPALAQAARTVGSPQIRHAATIGGNLGTASPAGDGLPVLAALDAVVHVASAAASRDVPFADFATGPKRTVLQPGELITGVTVPVLDGFQGYSKVGVRNAMVIATASACLALHRPDRSVRLALGSVGPVIIRAGEAESFAESAVDWDAGRTTPDVAAEFGRLAAAAARPIDDHRSSAAYRRRAIEVLAGRLLRRAFPDPDGEDS
jgi:CO/xanthine dehydrogenase FAD-binding subunit